MATKSLLFVGLLFAIILVISSDLVSAARPEPELAEITKGDVKVDGWHGGHHHGHCHYPHCREKADTNDHHEEAEVEIGAAKSDEAEDGYHKHKCKHWPHC